MGDAVLHCADKLTYGKVDELWHNRLHEVLVALVAYQGDQHLK